MPSPPPAEMTWSTGSPVSLRNRWTRSRRSQPLRSPGNVETMISSTRSSPTTFRAAVYGSGWTTCPWASMPAPRSSPSARRSRRSASACVLVVVLRGHDQEARRHPAPPVPDPVEQLRRDDGLVGDHEDVDDRRRPICRRRRASRGSLSHDARCRRRRRDATSPTVPARASRRRSRRPSARAAPARRPLAWTGPVSTTKPCAERPPSRSAASVRSRRRPADARRVSS